MDVGELKRLLKDYADLTPVMAIGTGENSRRILAVDGESNDVVFLYTEVEENG